MDVLKEQRQVARASISRPPSVVNRIKTAATSAVRRVADAGDRFRKSAVFARRWSMPAVDYTYPNGDRDAHPIGMDDWPSLLRLERARKLTFRDDRIRARFERMKSDL